MISQVRLHHAPGYSYLSHRECRGTQKVPLANIIALFLGSLIEYTTNAREESGNKAAKKIIS